MITNNKPKLNSDDVLFTKEGLESIQDEYENLVKVQRPAVLEELQSARALGDLSENGMYTAAREKQSFIEGRINQIEEVLKKAVVVERDDGPGGNDVVDLGVQVVLEAPDQKVTYYIVGAEEVNFEENKISHESPLGKALLGKKIGDEVEFEAPVGTVKYKIVDIK